MLEKIQDFLDMYLVKYDEIVPLRGENAEIQVYRLNYVNQGENMWGILSQLAPDTDFWPVDMPESHVPELVETDYDLVAKRLKESQDVLLPDTYLENLPNLNRAVLPEQRSAHMLTEPRCLPSYIFERWYPHSISRLKPRIRQLILIPGNNSWTAFAHLTEDYSRGMFKQDDPEPTAWVCHWEETYGARLCDHGGDGLTFKVEKPPQTNLEAYRVMTEHAKSGFGVDMIAQNYISEQSYAAQLLEKTYWGFWWD